VFLKRIVLPEAGKSLGAEISVGDISLRPFHEILLRDLKIQGKGQDPIVTAKEVRVRYRLIDILRGGLHVDDITLTEPFVRIVENPDGSRNLDPILKAQGRKTHEEKAPGPSKPQRIDLRNLVLRNGAMQMEKLYAGGRRDVIGLTNVNVALDNFKNGQTATLTLTADLEVATTPAPAAAKGLIEAAGSSAVFGTTTLNSTNELQLSKAGSTFTIAGSFNVDFSETNAIQGSLKLAADSLDVTGYYDLFADRTNVVTNAVAPAPSPATAPALDANQEPPALRLPFRKFTMQASIGRLRLREMEVNNLQTTVNLDGAHVLLKSCELLLNGAPVSTTADLDLGVPGWKYAVALDADRVRLAPLVSTFEPERKGQIGGTLSAHVRFEGAGITGASLQKSLSGQFDVGATNLDLNIANVRSRMLKTVVNTIAMVPELLHNPLSAIGTLFGGSTGRGGLTGELTGSPINVIAVRGSAGEGRINVAQALVRSAAFEADGQGAITLAQMLTHSILQIPVALSLSRSIASQLNLATGANTAYVRLPDFLTIKGALANPKAAIDKRALLGTTLKAVGGAVPGVNTVSGAVVQGLGGLSGGQSAPSNAVGTNPPAANQAPVNSLLPSKQE
jgi:uncharacterized protein involved in outer membrane biogenesis